MTFDEEPDGDPHGECVDEIERLRAKVETMSKKAYVNGVLSRQGEVDRLNKKIGRMEGQVSAYKEIVAAQKDLLIARCMEDGPGADLAIARQGKAEERLKKTNSGSKE